MILHDIFEGKMKELDIEYQDFLNSRGRNAMTDKMFQQAYGMSRTEWAKQNKEWVWQKERQPSAPDAHLFHEGINGEYDDEAGMAETNLHTIARAAQGLLDTIDDHENLPEWVQEKIAKVEGMMVAAWDYLKSQEEQGINPTIDEDWQKVNKKDRTAGMSKKAVKAYRRENPGSKLQTAVTTKPSKLKKGSKASKRRKSYCSRSKGQMKMHNISCQKTPDKAICAARRRWNCEESIAEGAMSNLHAELSDKYRELAPKIEKYKDSYLAGQLYDALESIAIEHNAELEFKRMLAGARNSAHMDYDTNPGGFQNWFWYLPFADDQDIAEGLRDPKDNPCWKGYKPVGTKQKGGRTVPNCVPKE